MDAAERKRLFSSIKNIGGELEKENVSF